MKWFGVLILLSVAVSAQYIADYPYFLFEERNFVGYVIKGDVREAQENTAANLAVNKIPDFYRPIFRILDGYNWFIMRADPRTITAGIRIASEIKSIDRPVIIIGTPCNNDWITKILNTENCNFIPQEEGIILITRVNNFPVVLITGGSPAAVLKAATWLHEEKHFGYITPYVRITRTGAISAVKVGNILQVEQPFGQVQPVVTVGYYPNKSTFVTNYVRI